MLDGYVAAIVAGPVSISPLDWICPLLAVDANAFTMAATPSRPLQVVPADPPTQAQWQRRCAPLVQRLLRFYVRYAAADIGLGATA